MMIDAFIGPRWRDLYAGGAGRRLPLPVLRRRHAAAPGRRWHDPPVRFEVEATDGTARAGRRLTPPAGRYRTPCFMPVGTRGRGASSCPRPTSTTSASRSSSATPTTSCCGPGAETVAALGGLGRFTGWDGLTLTDSGGFQVFSLEPDVDDDGVTFRSTYDGSIHRLTPGDGRGHAGAARAPTSRWCSTSARRCRRPTPVIRLAVERTAAWAKRARAGPPPRRPGPVRHRPGRHRRCAAGRERASGRSSSTSTATASVGCRWGRRGPRCCPRWPPPWPTFPADRPRYLMGVGDPASLVEAMALGVDQFDCVMQTRLGRHGVALTTAGRLQVKNARHARSDEPIDPALRLPGLRPPLAGVPPPPVPGRRAHRGPPALRGTTWPGRWP